MISEHSRISVSDLLYNTPSIEFFSLWNSIIKKVEMHNKEIEDSKKKGS